eukprot:15460776-Alexandrium_andersonii.AAC.1
MASNLAPEASEGCAMRRCSRRCRIRRRKGPAGAPEALLGWVPGGRSPPGKTEMINLLYLLCSRAGR